MASESALSALLLSAQLAGVNVSVLNAPPVASKPITVPAHRSRVPIETVPGPYPALFLSYPLAEIVQEQDRAFVSRPVGRGVLDFAISFGPGREPWAKVRQGGMIKAYPLSKLDGGLEVKFPLDTYRLVHEDGTVRIYTAAGPQEPQANYDVFDMMLVLCKSAEHAVFASLADYAIVYEDGRDVPAAIIMLRKDDADKNRIWVGYHPVSKLGKIKWFLSIDGVMYGARIEGSLLNFYTKLAPKTD